MNLVGKALKSKTVWVAILQAAGGIAAAVATDVDAVAWVAIAKSVVDISVRAITDKPLSEK